MKSIKDIGREVVELSDMEFVDPDTVDWGDEPETPKFTVYSDEERRELVREAVTQYEKFRAGSEANQMEKRTHNDWVAIFLEGLGL